MRQKRGNKEREGGGRGGEVGEERTEGAFKTSIVNAHSHMHPFQKGSLALEEEGVNPLGEFLYARTSVDTPLNCDYYT